VFEICQKPEAKVCDLSKEGIWNIPLGKNLHGATLDEWCDLQEAL
jgi:hypothetical protein